MTLSIVIPVYNERRTLGPVVAAVSQVLPNVTKEIIIVDDCSTDGTRDWLKANFADAPRTGANVSLDESGNLVFEIVASSSNVKARAIYHEKNLGKGGGVRTGLAAATSDVVVIQDADLEYDPQDWAAMYDLIAVRKIADVVYGSRFYGRPHRSLAFHHYLGNRVISIMFNLLFNQSLTDVQTCYKMMTREVAQSLRPRVNDFGIEIDLGSQIARQQHLRIFETEITYYGRTYEEGKKINWKDGVKGLWYLVKFRFTT